MIVINIINKEGFFHFSYIYICKVFYIWQICNGCTVEMNRKIQNYVNVRLLQILLLLTECAIHMLTSKQFCIIIDRGQQP